MTQAWCCASLFQSKFLDNISSFDYYFPHSFISLLCLLLLCIIIWWVYHGLFLHVEFYYLFMRNIKFYNHFLWLTFSLLIIDKKEWKKEEERKYKNIIRVWKLCKSCSNIYVQSFCDNFWTIICYIYCPFTLFFPLSLRCFCPKRR